MSSTNKIHKEFREKIKRLMKFEIPKPFNRRAIILDRNFTIRDGLIIFVDETKKRGYYRPKTFFLKPRFDCCRIKRIMEAADEYLLLEKLQKGTLRAWEIGRCRNAEIRGYLLGQFGYDKFIEQLRGKIIHKDGDYSLIALKWNVDEEPMRLVKVKDATSDKYYILRVPPNIKTCREAVAWTFDMTAKEYNPVKET